MSENIFSVNEAAAQTRFPGNILIWQKNIDITFVLFGFKNSSFDENFTLRFKINVFGLT